MSLLFDADWFDARLAERRLTRAELAAAAGLSRNQLYDIFSNERGPSAAELEAFAALLDADIVEVTLRSGVANRESGGDAGARIESIEARLDAIDDWLAEFEKARKRA